MPRRPQRQAWTDERLDEFARRTDENLKEIRAGIERRLNIVLGAVVGGIVTIVVGHFLG
jgi:hypothetical protein